MIPRSARAAAIAHPPIDIITGEVTRMRREGLEVINLGQAVCNLPLPEPLIPGLKQALIPEIINNYTPDEGLPALRAKVAQRYLRTFKVALNPQTEIMITAGANLAFMEVILALADPGDEIIINAPCYFDHEFAIKAAGCVPVISPLTETQQGFSLNPGDIRARITARTRAIVIVTPNNPTGAVFDVKDVMAVKHIIAGRDIFLISDETYDEFVFSPKVPYTALQPEPGAQVIVIGSFSKIFGLAGMRVGYVAAPAELLKELVKMQDAVIVCAPHLSQTAALLSFEAEADFVAKRRKILEQRKAIVTAGLSAIPALESRAIEGAFFAFPRYKSSRPSLELVLDILNAARVALIHGSAFGEAGEGHIRLSFGNTGEPELKTALERLKHYFG